MLALERDEELGEGERVEPEIVAEGEVTMDLARLLALHGGDGDAHRARRRFGLVGTRRGRNHALEDLARVVALDLARGRAGQRCIIQVNDGGLLAVGQLADRVAEGLLRARSRRAERSIESSASGTAMRPTRSPPLRPVTPTMANSSTWLILPSVRSRSSG